MVAEEDAEEFTRALDSLVIMKTARHRPVSGTTN